MAWVLLEDSSVTPSFSAWEDNAYLQGSTVVYDRAGGARVWTEWSMTFPEPRRMRLTWLEYGAASGRSGLGYHRGQIQVHGPGLFEIFDNEAPPYPSTTLPDSSGVTSFLPGEIDTGDYGTDSRVSGIYYRDTMAGSLPADDHYILLIEVWEDDEPPPDPEPEPDPGPSVEGYHVYELDRGWSFDGYYIPHFAELNWYFADNPFVDKSIQKVRIHGLAKGHAKLSLAVAGMQHEYDSDYTEPQYIDLPLNAPHISTEYFPTTNYVDSSNWGVSLQLKFEGRNCDLMRPEPSHVLQVLALQGSPQENGRRIN